MLHELCERLNVLGFPASLWPHDKPAGWRGARRELRQHMVCRRERRSFDAGLGPYRSRVARARDIRDAIVIYPEIVVGNPLNATNVVRWLLYKTTGDRDALGYGGRDLIIPYDLAFLGDAPPAPPPMVLNVTSINPAYRHLNHGVRRDDCYLVRKGSDKPLNAHPPGAIRIDGMTHAECADVFNKSRCLYSYDDYSFYGILAATCGCTPVIIPRAGVSEDEWEPTRSRRLGVAYGEGQIEWARSTHNELIRNLALARDEENRNVTAFAELALSYFES